MNTNNISCTNITTHLGTKCYQCPDPSVIPTYINETIIGQTTNNNFGKIVCNTKPSVFYGPTKDGLVSLFTGQFQCPGSSEPTMVNISSDQKSQWSSNNLEPRCQIILPF